MVLNVENVDITFFAVQHRWTDLSDTFDKCLQNQVFPINKLQNSDFLMFMVSIIVEEDTSCDFRVPQSTLHTLEIILWKFKQNYIVNCHFSDILNMPLCIDSINVSPIDLTH